MGETSTPSIEELRRRNRAALDLSAEAAMRHPKALHRLRRLAAAVVDEALDIGAYHDTAAEMVGLLETLCTIGSGTLFVYYRRGLDPNCEGHVRTFRPLCRDLLTVLDELDRWRAAKQRIRRVK